ncbi:nitroreductase family protein [Mycobacterium servetii]|uniref:nitroreductase family protein n=1 Tax=Mycobacterium servetii TaxID=3237418 RepID=UPI00350EC3E4
MDIASVDELLTTTRAVRKRLDLDRPVGRDVILECIRLAIQAPTASNAQDWRWLVVTDADKRAAIADTYRGIARHLSVAQQPRVDHLDIRVDRRPRPARVGLTRRREGRSQRLAHRTPMHLMPLGQLADRQLLDPPVTPDLFEQFHPRPHHSRTSTPMTTDVEIASRVGPIFATTR